MNLLLIFIIAFCCGLFCGISIARAKSVLTQAQISGDDCVQIQTSNPWKIIQKGSKYEVHNEFGYHSEYDTYSDASQFVHDWLENFERECVNAYKHR